MIAIIDYGVGNLFSLKSSLKQLGLEAVVTADADTIRKADRLILPGVGAFADAMAKLEATGLVPVMKEEAERKPLLGICLGMQLLFEKSYEYGEHEGLGFVKGEVCPLEPDLADKTLKVPQIGWNALHIVKDDPLFKYIREGEYVYYTSPLLRQELYGEYTGGERLFHSRHRRGAGRQGVRHPVPPGKERGYWPAHSESICGIVRRKIMQLFPAIDLRGGKVVRLTQGDYSRMTVYGEDPCAQAREFLAAGAKICTSIWTAQRTTPINYDTIAALAKQGRLIH